MDKYITFETNVSIILNSLEGSSESIDLNSDVSGFVDSVIKTAMEKELVIFTLSQCKIL